jgi:hypothetical protein
MADEENDIELKDLNENKKEDESPVVNKETYLNRNDGDLSDIEEEAMMKPLIDKVEVKLAKEENTLSRERVNEYGSSTGVEAVGLLQETAVVEEQIAATTVAAESEIPQDNNPSINVIRRGLIRHLSVRVKLAAAMCLIFLIFTIFRSIPFSNPLPFIRFEYNQVRI